MITPRRLIEMVDARTGQAHLVSQNAMTTGLRSGRYVAVCGAVVLTASLTDTAQSSCRSCAKR